MKKSIYWETELYIKDKQLEKTKNELKMAATKFTKSQSKNAKNMNWFILRIEKRKNKKVESLKTTDINMYSKNNKKDIKIKKREI